MYLTILFFIVRNSEEEKVRSFQSSHPEVFKGIIIVISMFIFLEIIMELIMEIIWS